MGAGGSEIQRRQSLLAVPASSDAFAALGPGVAPSVIGSGSTHHLVAQCFRNDCGLLKHATRTFGMCRSWERGVEPGGRMPSPSRNFADLSVTDQLFQQRLAYNMLFVVRGLSLGEQSDLRGCARAMCERGVAPLSRPTQEFSPAVLRDQSGQGFAISPEALNRFTSLYALAVRDALSWSRTLPSEEHRKSNVIGPVEAGLQISDRERREAIGALLAFGKFSERQISALGWGDASSAARNQPCHLELFSAEFKEFWGDFQFRCGFALAKGLEPGGTSHKSIESYRHSRTLDPRDQIFVGLISEAQLDYLSRIPPTAFDELVRVGVLMNEGGIELSQGELVDPLRGVPLIVPQNGVGRAVLPEGLHLHLAFENHLAWVNLRRFSRSLPVVEYRQNTAEKRKDKAEVEWQRGEDFDANRHNPDLRKALGLCYALGILATHSKYSNQFETFKAAVNASMAV